MPYEDEVDCILAPLDFGLATLPPMNGFQETLAY